jgi:hypothetical protein
MNGPENHSKEFCFLLTSVFRIKYIQFIYVLYGIQRAIL